MHVITRKRLTLLGLVAVLGVGVTAPAATSAHAKAHKALGAGLVKAGVKYIGLTKQQVRAELPGHSLAQVAVAHGKTVDGLEAAMLAAAKAKLDKAVASGKRTPAQEAAALTALPARIDKLANHVFKGLSKVARQGVAARGVVKAGLAYIGLTTKAQVRAELPGHSLAQLAVNHGKTVEGLEAAMLAAAKTKLDKAVAAGKVTQPNADARLAKLAARIDKFVNRVHKAA